MIDRIKVCWTLLKETKGYLLHPSRILQMRDVLAMYHESIDHYTAETWKDEVVQGLKQELDARKAAMDEEEQAHEAAEEELRGEIKQLEIKLRDYRWRYGIERDSYRAALRTIADLKSRLAAALAEKAYLLAEKAEWLKEGDPDRVPSETTPSDC